MLLLHGLCGCSRVASVRMPEASGDSKRQGLERFLSQRKHLKALDVVGPPAETPPPPPPPRANLEFRVEGFELGFRA